jgi:hypothetical protein
MNEVVGVHCARELIRLGVATQSALDSLMDELDIDEADARKAIRVALHASHRASGTRVLTTAGARPADRGNRDGDVCSRMH